MKRIIFLLIISGLSTALFGQGFKRIEQTEIIKVAGIKTDAQVEALATQQKQTNRVFYDGLDRPLQTIAVKASPFLKDIVQPMVYDDLGRQTKTYLPYVGADGYGRFNAAAVTTDQPAFYANGTADKVADDNNPFAQSVFENSPLQRLLSSGNVGSGFQPVSGQHYKTVNYRSNNVTTDGSIIIWGPEGTNLGTYTDNKLSVTEGIDEDGGTVLTFTDFAGHLVLKRQKANTIVGGSSVSFFDTYYVYNNAGMVSFIIPPKATSLIKANNWALSHTTINSLVFRFVYDTKGRLSEKVTPSSGSVYFIYDPLDRIVLVQDIKTKQSNKWNYIKYDIQGRAISQGMYTNAATAADMQATVDALDYSTAWYEGRSSAASTGYYTNNVFPTGSTGTIEPLAYSFYDDYDLNQDGALDYSYIAQSLPGEAAWISAPRGRLTMVRKRSVGPGVSTNFMLLTAYFYDKFGNVIQRRSNNHINTSTQDSQTLVPDFTGKPTLSKDVHVVAGNITTVQTTYSYDHMSRITAIDQKYNSNATLRIAAYGYNELGQLVTKQLHGSNTGSVPQNVILNGSNGVASGATSTVIATSSITMQPGFVAVQGSTFAASIVPPAWLQTVDYRYNIRGQLLSINNSKLNSDGIKNNDENDVFGMELNYDEVDGNLNNTASFSGRLTATKWMSRGGDNGKSWERSYRYMYDLPGRLTDALYAERSTTATGSFNGNIGGFNESGISYDENGNIQTLKRNSSQQGTNNVVEIDNLVYAYDSTNPNRINRITDGSGTNYTNYGFRNVTGSTASYGHEVNTGNMTADPYKGLSLSYNILDKTDRITVTTATNRYIDYSYDGTGKLLRKQVYDNNALQNTTDYIDGYVYTTTAGTTTLAYFTMPEGRVRNAGGTLINEYAITDQQGNTRVIFDNSGGGGSAKVIQENSYYAFGMVMGNSPVPMNTTPNKNLYNGGSEWQNDYSNLPDYYQTFYRNYDAATGRFIAVDPIAEATDYLSPYQYGNDNPIMFNDPMGDLSKAQWSQVLDLVKNGGRPDENYRFSDNQEGFTIQSNWEAFGDVTDMLDRTNGWGSIAAGSFQNAFTNLSNGTVATGNPDQGGIQALNQVTVQYGNEKSYRAASDNIYDQIFGNYKGEILSKHLGDFAYGFTNLPNTSFTPSNLPSIAGFSTSAIESILKNNPEEAYLAEVAGKTGKALGVLGIALTAKDIYNQRGGLGNFTAGDYTKITLQFITFLPYVGVGYAALDLGFQTFTHKSLTDRIGSAVDNTINHW